MLSASFLLLDLYTAHVALLVASRNARWHRRPELLLEEEQLRAEQELILAVATAELNDLLYPSGPFPLACELAARCLRVGTGDGATTLSALIEGHEEARHIAERLAAVADIDGDLILYAIAHRRAREHSNAIEVLDKLRRRVAERARQCCGARPTA